MGKRDIDLFVVCASSFAGYKWYFLVRKVKSCRPKRFILLSLLDSHYLCYSMSNEGHSMKSRRTMLNWALGGSSRRRHCQLIDPGERRKQRFFV